MEFRGERLPGLLVDQLGNRIESVQQWQQRRGEIIELFRKHVYGRASVDRPLQMDILCSSEEVMMDGRAIRKMKVIRMKGPGGEIDIPVCIFVPVKCSSPAPAFLLINNRNDSLADPDRNSKSGFWPAEQLVERGYAAVVFHVRYLDPDEHDGFQNGVHGIFDNLQQGEERADDAWGTIGAWAFGASRVLDALEQEPAIDANRVAVVGHSRAGKTALWAAAQDERFAMAVSNNSGCTGAAISRQNLGERIKDINTAFPHWFAANYKQFNDNEKALPLDQHMLLGLIAPRLLYVVSASQDSWADPEGEYSSLCLAEEAYQLYGHEVQAAMQMPSIGVSICTEKTAYHIREGKHDLTLLDWQLFMDFADSRL